MMSTMELVLIKKVERLEGRMEALEQLVYKVRKNEEALRRQIHRYKLLSSSSSSGIGVR